MAALTIRSDSRAQKEEIFSPPIYHEVMGSDAMILAL